MTATRPLVFALALVLTAGIAAPDALAQKKGKEAAATPALPTACTDFYVHINKAWLDANPLPPGATSFGQLDQINALALEQQRLILDAAMTGPQDAHQRVLGDFWASGLDEAAVERAGIAPIQPLLERIDKIKRTRHLAEVVAELHARGLPVLFNFDADIDLQDFSRTIAYATQGGLGLPDPEYYTREDADTRALLGRYRGHVEKILALTGVAEADAKTLGGHVVQLEMQLAKASQKLVDLRNPANAYRPTAVAELDKTYPELKLADFVKAQKVAVDSVSLAHTAYFAEANRLLGATPAEQWKAYLRFHVANAMAPYLSKGFADAHSDLYGRVLGGQTLPLPRQLAVLQAVNAAIGETMGAEYVEKHLPSESEALAERIAGGVRETMGSAIDRAAWMSAPARQVAKAKLEALRVEVGRPESGFDFTTLQFDRASYGGNVLAAAASRHAQEMALIGRPATAGRRWPTLPQVPDVSYDLDENRLIVTAALLQPPVFDPDADIATNYGALGSLVFNQVHHAFDNRGRAIDADGKLRDWWSAADASAYEQRIGPLIAQYDAYGPEPGLRVNGRHTRDENAADLAGVELALEAFHAAVPSPTPGKAEPVKGRATAKTPQQLADQRFFEGWAGLWPQHYSPEELKLRLATDVHAPAPYRVNGPLTNIPAFTEAFICDPGQPLRAKTPVSVWR